MTHSLRSLGLALAMALSIPAAAQHPGHGEFGGGPGFGMGFLKQLDLTADQKTKLKAIRQSGKDQMRTLRKDAHAAREALQEAMAGTADDATLTKLFSDSQAKQQAAATQGFQQLLKVRAILTPEQRAKVKTLMDEKRPHGHRPHGDDHDEE